MNPNLDQYFWLPRAGRYSTFWDANARLPIVYGDPGLSSTPSSVYNGRWVLPAINISTTIEAGYVVGIDFCYSVGKYAHPLAERGRIFINEAVISSGDYEVYSTHYEGDPLHITYVHFTKAYPRLSEGEVVSAIGNGISSSTNSTAIDSNIINNAVHFLTKISTYSTSFLDKTLISEARSKFDNAGYVSFGVINEDASHWDILQNMIGGFIGNAWINNWGKISMDIGTTFISPYQKMAIIPKSEIEFRSAIQKESNLINQIPVSYDYSWPGGDFKQHSDSTAQVSKKSQHIFGKQEPASPLQLRFCNNLTIANKIQSVYVDNYKFPKWEILIEDKTLKRANIDLNDIVICSFDEIYQRDGNPFTNRALRVIGISPNFQAGTIQFRLLDTNYNLGIDGNLTTGSTYDLMEY